MRFILALAAASVVTILADGAPSYAGQVPFAVPAPDLPVSHQDRVYAADQYSNTISVIDPVYNKPLGVIRLGDPARANLSPLYGASCSSMAWASRRTNARSLLFRSDRTRSRSSTREKRGEGTSAYVGRSPHEAFFTPDGKEVWVTVRGENYVDVLDANSFWKNSHHRPANGPGMTIFSPDGKYG